MNLKTTSMIACLTVAVVCLSPSPTVAQGGAGAAPQLNAISIRGTGVSAGQNDLPPAVQRLEQGIARQASRFGAGVRAGVGLDPELVLVGVHGQVGPIFHPDVYFRPNVEFGLGEVTALLALNVEAIYRLPGSSGDGGWSAYFGAGPGFNFTHQNFERFTDDGTDEGSRIDFGEFDNSTSLNILGGVQYRSGPVHRIEEQFLFEHVVWSQTDSWLQLLTANGDANRAGPCQ